MNQNQLTFRLCQSQGHTWTLCPKEVHTLHNPRDPEAVGTQLQCSPHSQLSHIEFQEYLLTVALRQHSDCLVWETDGGKSIRAL
jgi:hypothetical protein